ncbi:hypothetical protein L7F22_053028 [Adiantum nelumboides]|nr:hypothetical protein [Adiantum nelumboides]
MDPSSLEVDGFGPDHVDELSCMQNNQGKRVLLRELLDISPLLSEAAGAIVDDTFTRCFKSNPPETWNWNLYLFPLWCLGVLVRYLVLFPIRLRTMKGKERLVPKLGMRYYRPFRVCDKISDVAYRRKLPEGWKIHNPFHVPANVVPEEQLEVEELDEILVPEQILAHKERKVKGKVARRYLVKFKDYSPMDAKWIKEAELVDSPQLLRLYLEAFQLQPTVTR